MRRVVVGGRAVYIFIWVIIISAIVVHKGDCSKEESEEGKNDESAKECRPVPEDQKTTFLWKISKQDLNADSYLFGTIHVDYKDVWDSVSFEAKQALFNSDSIYLEVSKNDLEALNEAEEKLRCKDLEYGVQLEEFLTLETYIIVEKFMQKLYDILTSGQDEALHEYLNDTIVVNWRTRKPLALFMELEQFFGDMSVPEFSQVFTEHVLDDYIEMVGAHFNKTIGSIEGPERECYVFEDPSDDAWILKYLSSHFDLSNVSLSNITSIEETKDELYNETTKFLNDYNCGIFIVDLDEHDISLKLEDIHKKDQERLERLNRKLENSFYKRNMNMAKKIGDLIMKNSSASYFFAFGYGHFFGKNNVRELLEQKYGYNVTEVKRNTLWSHLEEINNLDPEKLNKEEKLSYRARQKSKNDVRYSQNTPQNLSAKINLSNRWILFFALLIYSLV